MSLSRGCVVVETKPGEWFCVVADDEHDYDFESGSTSYGPAKTADAAIDMMSERECNPGGFHIVNHWELTDGDRKLAERNVRSGRSSYGRYR